MWLIVLEAVAALAVLVFLVWWTMFSGRRGGELPPELSQELPPKVPPQVSPDRSSEQLTGEAARHAQPAHEDEAGGDAGERGGNKKLKG